MDHEEWDAIRAMPVRFVMVHGAMVLPVGAPSMRVLARLEARGVIVRLADRWALAEPGKWPVRGDGNPG